MGPKGSINGGLNGCNGLLSITSTSTRLVWTKGLLGIEGIVSSIRGVNHCLTNGPSSLKRGRPLILLEQRCGRLSMMNNKDKPEWKNYTYDKSIHQVA